MFNHHSSCSSHGVWVCNRCRSWQDGIKQTIKSLHCNPWCWMGIWGVWNHISLFPINTPPYLLILCRKIKMLLLIGKHSCQVILFPFLPCVLDFGVCFHTSSTVLPSESRDGPLKASSSIATSFNRDLWMFWKLLQLLLLLCMCTQPEQAHMLARALARMHTITCAHVHVCRSAHQHWFHLRQ